MRGLEGYWRVLRAPCLATIAGLILASNGFAAALVQDVKGDVRTAAAAVEKGQRILTGATLTTGPSSQAILVFDDGQEIVLNENTQFTITDYRFAKDNPQSDRSFLNLLRGAARVVTGALVQRSRTSFELRSPTSTIGIRGTDFMVAIVDQPSYLSVLQGEIAATNAAGTVTFGAGTFGAITAATVLAVAIPAVALPAAAAAAFSSLGAAAVGATAAAAAGAAGGAGIGTVAAVGAVAAGAAVAGGGGGGGGGSATPTTGTSAFAGPFHGTSLVTVSGTYAGTAVPSGSCTGTISGTVDSAGNVSGTSTITSCTSGGDYYETPGTVHDLAGVKIDAAGNFIASASTFTYSGLTDSCSAPTATWTATTFSGSQQCTLTGTLTPCATSNCSVNLSSTYSFTGTRP
jgi:hypothetical protein